jgi:hypothetical protein
MRYAVCMTDHLNSPNLPEQAERAIHDYREEQGNDKEEDHLWKHPCIPLETNLCTAVERSSLEVAGVDCFTKEAALHCSAPFIGFCHV